MTNDKTYFVTGIGTGIGKTIVSAVLTEKLKADYWKPIQSGDLDSSDTLKVKSLISNEQAVFYPETYRLTQPYSPHKSAAIDGIEIDLEQFILPKMDSRLIIEGAGGLMVPLNNRFLMIDLIKKLDVSVILVSQNYLGSINHTLLSAAILKQYDIAIEGIIFNGKTDTDSEGYILNYTGLRRIGGIPEFGTIDKGTIIAAGKYIDL